MLQNRLKYYRHQLLMNQTQMCKFLEYKCISRYNQFENHPNKHNPNSETMYKFWEKIKTKIPNIHLEDLWIKVDP